MPREGKRLWITVLAGHPAKHTGVRGKHCQSRVLRASIPLRESLRVEGPGVRISRQATRGESPFHGVTRAPWSTQSTPQVTSEDPMARGKGLAQ